MLTKMKEKSQVTIPKALVEQLGLKPGDSLDAYISGGTITLVPMAFYPKPKMDKVAANIAAAQGGSVDNAEAIEAIATLFGSMSDTAMSSVAFAASKLADQELE